VAVRILFFAGVRDLMGQAELRAELPRDVADVGAFRAWLVREYPQLESSLPQVRIAVNESFANDTEALGANDVVALIPPVSGG
jgi:molybdopterin converting factor subunit 1